MRERRAFCCQSQYHERYSQGIVISDLIPAVFSVESLDSLDSFSLQNVSREAHQRKSGFSGKRRSYKWDFYPFNARFIALDMIYWAAAQKVRAKGQTAATRVNDFMHF